jgi:hypothetical protein
MIGIGAKRYGPRFRQVSDEELDLTNFGHECIAALRAIENDQSMTELPLS